MTFHKNDVVQFTENHKWCGSLGIVDEIKELSEDTRYMVGVPIPQQGTAFIFTMESENDIAYVGKAIMTLPEDEEEA